MSFVYLFRYLKGFVCFYAEGVFIEKFLNSLIKNNIPFWNISRTDISVSVYIPLKKYKTVEQIAQKCGMTISIREKFGLPFIIERYKKRLGLLIGIIIFCSTLFVLNFFVWDVTVSGNSSVSTQKVLEIAEKYGVKVGALSSSIDELHVERCILRELDGISWITVNIQNSVVRIEINETDPPPQMFPADDAVVDLVAKHSGVIQYIELYNGTAFVKEGDAVLPGDTLISGTIIDPKGNVTLKHSSAKVIARTNYRIHIEIPLNQSVKNYSDSIFRHQIKFLGADIPLYFKKYSNQSEVIYSEKTVRFLWFDLPIKIQELEFIPYSETQTMITQSEAEVLANKELKKRKELELKDAEIYSEDTQGFLKENVYHLISDYYCDIDIAEEKFIAPIPSFLNLSVLTKNH